MRHLHVPKYDELNLGDSVAVIMGLKLPAPLQGARQGFLPNRDIVENKENVPKSMEDFKSWILIIHPNSDEHIKKIFWWEAAAGVDGKRCSRSCSGSGNTC